MFLFFPVKIGLYLKCCYHNTKGVLVQLFELWTHLLSFAPYQQQTIQERTVISDWSKAPQLLLITCLVVWKFSLMASGAQFVMISGDRQSLMLPVDSLGIHVLHSLEMPHFWGEKKPLVFIIVCSWHVLVKTATNSWYFPVHCKKYICADVSFCRFGEGTGQIWLDDVRCSSSDSNIIGCSHRGIGSHNCRHSEDISVNCVNTAAGKSSLGP